VAIAEEENRRKQARDRAVAGGEKEHQDTLARRAIIERRRELVEIITMREERELASKRAMKQQQEAEVEQRRQAEELRKKELARMQKEKENIKLEEAKKLADELLAKGVKLDEKVHTHPMKIKLTVRISLIWIPKVCVVCNSSNWTKKEVNCLRSYARQVNESITSKELSAVRKSPYSTKTTKPNLPMKKKNTKKLNARNSSPQPKDIKRFSNSRNDWRGLCPSIKLTVKSSRRNDPRNSRQGRMRLDRPSRQRKRDEGHSSRNNRRNLDGLRRRGSVGRKRRKNVFDKKKRNVLRRKKQQDEKQKKKLKNAKRNDGMNFILYS
jgi:translation initiation factor 3 subunit A